ncbi:hypothetical protein ABIB95_002211 [Bradyrhizobium sp. LA2.1]
MLQIPSVLCITAICARMSQLGQNRHLIGWIEPEPRLKRIESRRSFRGLPAPIWRTSLTEEAIMPDISSVTKVVAKRIPWNKGRIVGAKPPLRPKHVWSIRTKLQVEGRVRDLALFNLAIDSKLRGGDVVALKVGDIAPRGYAADRATVRQKKTGRPGSAPRAVDCGPRMDGSPCPFAIASTSRSISRFNCLSCCSRRCVFHSM